MNNQLFNQLRQEHQQLKQIIFQIIGATENSRNSIFEELKLSLLPHMQAEEKAFYPVLTQKNEACQAALEALEEHHVAKTIFNDIQQTSSTSDLWLAKCKVLSDLLNHHIEEEENEIFELTRKTIPEQVVSEIYNNFLSIKNDFRGRLAA